MPNYVINQNPSAQDRFYIMDGQNIVAQGSYKGRSKEQIMTDFTSKVRAPVTQTPAGMLGNPAVQQQLVSSPRGSSMVNTIKGIRDVTETPSPKTNIPTTSSDALDQLNAAVGLNRVALRIKQKNKIDTGPIANFMETSGINNALDRKNPAVQFMIGLHNVNPYRKLVTGAQAAEVELRKFIIPAIPNFGDNDKRYEAKAHLYHLINTYNKQILLNGLKSKGYDVSGYEKEPPQFIGMDGKVMNEMNKKAVMWALENISSPEFREKATKFLKHNDINPDDIMTLDTYMADNPKEFEKMDTPEQLAVQKSMIEQGKGMLEEK